MRVVLRGRYAKLCISFPVVCQLGGGVQTLDEAAVHMKHIDGIMLGRVAYHTPYSLADIDERFYQDNHAIPTRQQIIEAYLPYVEKTLSEGVNLSHLIRPILGLFQGVPGARAWRRYLSEHGHLPRADATVILAALFALSARYGVC